MLPGIEAPAQSVTGVAKRNPDTVCASSRNGCLLDARNTSGGVYPGGGVEE